MPKKKFCLVAVFLWRTD